ncbi:MAG: undecaprenyl-diphosphate phosphatase [Pirellulaceae bacterium]|nr:undecaprenyl-diphosphate phosphatase [Pirellulaceae bacterium]
MNNYCSAVVIGIVEGLTEFLPVSSTAHIRFTQEILGLPRDDEYWKMFAVVIQLGAILSVIVYFWKRLLAFLHDFRRLLSNKPMPTSNTSVEKLRTQSLWTHPLSLVALAFVVTAIPCFLIDKTIGENLENPTMMAWALIVGGIAMWLIDTFYSHGATTKTIEEISWRQAIFIGLSQILAAAFPGTSRSMSTIAGGQLVGLSRTASLEFSFLLSIPVMFAATLFKLLQFTLKQPIQINSEQWIVLAIGFVVSFIVALAVIAWFLHWVRQKGFTVFAIYRILAGVAVLYWLYRPAT